MKKIAALALAVTMAISLTACSKPAAAPSTAPAPSASAPAASPTTGEYTKDSPEIIQLGQIGNEIAEAYNAVTAMAEPNGWLADEGLVKELQLSYATVEVCRKLAETPPTADQGMDIPSLITQMEGVRDMLKGEMLERVSVPYTGAGGGDAAAASGLVTQTAGGITIDLPEDMVAVESPVGYAFQIPGTAALVDVGDLAEATVAAADLTEEYITEVITQQMADTATNLGIVAFDNAVPLGGGTAAVTQFTADSTNGMSLTGFLIYFFTADGQVATISLMYQVGANTSLETNAQAVLNSIMPAA